MLFLWEENPMPTKTKTPAPKKTSHAAIKKTITAKPFVAKSLALKSVLKNVKPSSKVVAKKVKTKKPEVIVVEEMNIGKNKPLSLPIAIDKEIILVHRCANCDHIPFSLPSLVGILSVLILLLSASMLIQTGQINLMHLISLVSPHAFAATQGF